MDVHRPQSKPRGRFDTSAVAERHMITPGDRMNWEGIRIIDKEVNWHSSKVKKALHTEAAKPALNYDRGVEVSASWLKLVYKRE